MKNVVKFVGIIAFVVVIGFSFVACKDDLNGTTWSYSYTEEDSFYGLWDVTTTVTAVITFKRPNFTWRITDEGKTKSYSGKYSISGSKITFTVDDEKVTGSYSIDDLKLTISDTDDLDGTYTKIQNPENNPARNPFMGTWYDEDTEDGVCIFVIDRSTWTFSDDSWEDGEVVTGTYTINGKTATFTYDDDGEIWSTATVSRNILTFTENETNEVLTYRKK